MPQGRFTKLLFLLSFSMLPGIAGAQDAARSSQGLTAGANSVAAAELAQRGLITVATRRPDGSGVLCSGVLLSNTTALTAGHCIDAIQGSVTTITPSFGGIAVTADAIYKFGGWAGDPDGPDIGLLRLSRPVRVNGSNSGFVTPLYAGDASGKTVTVYGASTGSYLKADMPVDRIEGRNLVLNKSVDGVTTAQGDSGGPAFISENGQMQLAGLTSTSGPPASSAAVAPHRNWIIAATLTFLAQSEPYATAVSLQGEIASVPEGNLLPVGPAPLAAASWARSQRVAQAMCIRRGFVGGLFTPGLDSNQGGLPVTCIGRSGGTWRDAGRTELAAVGITSGDPDATSWNHQAQASTALCGQTVKGADTGFLTGFSSAPATDPAGRLGLICLQPWTGRMIAVGPAQLTLAGSQGITSPDWLQARQAATAWCRALGYAGGFTTAKRTRDAQYVGCIGPVGIESLSPILEFVLNHSVN